MLAFLALIESCWRLITSPHLLFPGMSLLMPALRTFFLNQRPCLNILNNFIAFLFLIAFFRNHSAFCISRMAALRADKQNRAANFFRQHNASAFRTEQQITSTPKASVNQQNLSLSSQAKEFSRQPCQ